MTRMGVVVASEVRCMRLMRKMRRTRFVLSSLEMLKVRLIRVISTCIDSAMQAWPGIQLSLKRCATVRERCAGRSWLCKQ